MNINEASKLLTILLSQTDKKTEQKIYNCFIRTLSSLENKDLTEKQTQLIQVKLSSLNLNVTTENKKKYYKQKLSEFKSFLKEKFSFTSAKHYTETWMIYGMIFGTGLGMSIGTVINTGFGTSMGMSIGTGVGMAIGILFGARKDAEAKKQGTVI